MLALNPFTAQAQTGLATVTGIITDSSGGAIPGLTVTATNQATNVPYTGVTNASGTYTINALPIGDYIVKAELEGFKTAGSKVALVAGQTGRMDFRLEVGSLAERVEVVATSIVMQTENAVVGSTLEQRQVEKLPVQGRNLATATLFTADGCDRSSRRGRSPYSGRRSCTRSCERCQTPHRARPSAPRPATGPRTVDARPPRDTPSKAWPSPLKGQSVTHVSGIKCYPCLGRDRRDPVLRVFSFIGCGIGDRKRTDTRRCRTRSR